MEQPLLKNIIKFLLFMKFAKVVHRQFSRNHVQAYGVLYQVLWYWNLIHIAMNILHTTVIYFKIPTTKENIYITP